MARRGARTVRPRRSPPLNVHFFVADATGRSVILEYAGDAWHRIVPVERWQVLGNEVMRDTPDTSLRERCWHYRTVAEAPEKCDGRVDAGTAMTVLEDAARKSTTWTVVYLPNSAELRVAVGPDWDRIYRLLFP